MKIFLLCGSYGLRNFTQADLRVSALCMSTVSVADCAIEETRNGRDSCRSNSKNYYLWSEPWETGEADPLRELGCGRLGKAENMLFLDGMYL
jgi:hypothetical protein